MREKDKMKCPFCGYTESKVIDSRPAEEGATIRRRRECLACSKRFTTYEIIERMPLVVVKRDGSRQSFDKVKLINGMVREKIFPQFPAGNFILETSRGMRRFPRFPATKNTLYVAKTFRKLVSLMYFLF